MSGNPELGGEDAHVSAREFEALIRQAETDDATIADWIQSVSQHPPAGEIELAGRTGAEMEADIPPGPLRDAPPQPGMATMGGMRLPPAWTPATDVTYRWSMRMVLAPVIAYGPNDLSAGIEVLALAVSFPAAGGRVAVEHDFPNTPPGSPRTGRQMYATLGPWIVVSDIRRSLRPLFGNDAGSRVDVTDIVDQAGRPLMPSGTRERHIVARLIASGRIATALGAGSASLSVSPHAPATVAQKLRRGEFCLGPPTDHVRHPVDEVVDSFVERVLTSSGDVGVLPVSGPATSVGVNRFVGSYRVLLAHPVLEGVQPGWESEATRVVVLEDANGVRWVLGGDRTGGRVSAHAVEAASTSDSLMRPARPEHRSLTAALCAAHRLDIAIPSREVRAGIEGQAGIA